MLKHDTAKKTITLQNNTLRVTVGYADGVTFEELSNVKAGGEQNCGREAFCLSIYGKNYTSRDFTVVDVTTAQDRVMELASFLLELKEEGLKLKLHLMNDGRDTITVLYQVYDSYKLGVPSVCKLHMPLLAQLQMTDRDTKYYPAGAVKTPDGENVLLPVRELFYSTDVILPLVVCDSEEHYGFSVQFPVVSDLTDTGAAQNINSILRTIANESDLRDHEIQINPVEMRIVGLSNGWPEAFDRCRDYWAANYDFAEYEREDLKWFNDCVVHNFTFLYGSEGFDHEKQKIDVESLLKQGEDFGGYDTVTIWNQYPRLGIDKRSQWDFYDDFPGGRPALRKAVDEFHAAGVPVFLPYIPWDRGMNESTESMGDEFARIVADTDADGYQLDTMKDLPYSYRKKLDKVKPGLVLTTQSHPMKKHPIEFITTSWDEFWYTDPMPEVDVFRFINPRHLAPVISRWLRLEDKDVLIKRVEFGAAPIVIWQDIFGRWMPFNDAQRAEIKHWKETYLKYRAIYQGLKPIPLYPTKVKNLYCNLFVGDAGEGQIYSFYNDSDEELHVKDLPVYLYEGKKAEVILGVGSATIAANKLNGTVAPGAVVHVLVK